MLPYKCRYSFISDYVSHCVHNLLIIKRPLIGTASPGRVTRASRRLSLFGCFILVLDLRPGVQNVWSRGVTAFSSCNGHPDDVSVPRIVWNTLYFLWRNSPARAWAASLFRFLDDTHTHTVRRTPLNERSACRRGRYLHSTQHSQVPNIHVLSWIRTHDPSNRAPVELRVRPRDHWDQLRMLLADIMWYGFVCVTSCVINGFKFI
jgi:hypothetical protein